MIVPLRLDRRRSLRLVGALLFTVLVLMWLNPNWTDRSLHQVQLFDPKINLADPTAQSQLCKAHGWTPFKNAAQRKVYDLIMVNTELDWLEIRLSSTYDYVDYFVIVESAKTFTNLDKPLVIKDNMERFAPYHDKIIYHQLEIPTGFHSDRENPSWAWEDLQRDAMYKQVIPRLTGERAPNHGDVLIVADVDELIRPQTMVVLRACNFPRRLTLRSDFFYYSFQFRHVGPQWAHPEATYYQGWRTITPVNLRNSDGGLQPLIRLEKGTLWSAGWHCSTCFSTITEVLTKLSSFSHVALNAQEYRNPARIADRVRSGLDLWDRETEKYERIENNQDLPPIL
ncbi:glycosyl transferase, partial [Microdochium bolleyi]